MAVALGGLALGILFKKNGSFPEHRIGHNKEMRKRKIYCVNTQEKIEQIKLKKARKKFQKERELLITGKNNTSLIDYSDLKI
ncbi:MAG: hypothetical protein U9R19_17890 [Bacteroidota bacterium]|nr:hypothetical protein [Bacteroidota bacterium]